MSLEAFSPQGNTQALTAALNTSANIQLAAGSNEVRVFNAGAATAFIAFGDASSLAVVIPTLGTPANGMPIGAGDSRTFQVGPSGKYLAAISGSALSIYATVGNGAAT